MTVQRLSIAAALSCVLGFCAHLIAQGEGTPVSTSVCSVAVLQQKAPKGTTITSARSVDASNVTPRHCQVDGHTASPGNEVNFRLTLPEQWNGKFYFAGVG